MLLSRFGLLREKAQGMKAWGLPGSRRAPLSRFAPGFLKEKVRAREGQALVETVMTTGFLVALALVLDKSLGPIVVKAFENIAKALSSVGP